MTKLIKIVKVLLILPLFLFVLFVACVFWLKNSVTELPSMFDDLIDVLREWWRKA